MDVKMTFLNGELEEDIYMDHSQGFVQENQEYHVCKMKKSLYGLRHRLKGGISTFKYY